MVVRQHTVSQFYLRNFSVNNNQKQIFVYDKPTEKVFSAPIDRVAFENNFFDDPYLNQRAIEIGAPTGQLFEAFLAEEERLKASLINSLIERIRTKRFEYTLEEKWTLCEWAATQYVRTKGYRQMVLQYGDSFQRAQLTGMFPSEWLDQVRFAPESEARYHIELSFGNEIMDSMMLTLFEHAAIGIGFLPADNLFLYTSDNPVVRTSPGFGQAGCKILIPIAPDCCIKFELPEENEKYPTGYDGRFFSMGTKELHYWNYLQVRQSERQIYSATSDFEFVQKIIDQEPSLKLLNRKRMSSIVKNNLFIWEPTLP